MADQVALPNFSKGELAPLLWGRVDAPQYSAGLRRARNFIVQRYGGVSFRPGTRLVGKVDDPTQPVRLAAFQFSIDQAYVLVMGQGGMRPVANGGFVLEDDLKITAITKAANAQVTAAFHGYAVGDRVYFANVVGMVEINGRFGKVLSVPTANTFTVDIDSTGFSTFVSSGGIVRTGSPTPPPVPPVVPPVVPATPPPDTGGWGGTLPYKPPPGTDYP